MNPKTAAKWIEAHQWMEKQRGAPAILAQEAAKRFRQALRTATPAKPRIRLPRAQRKLTPQGIKKDLKKELEALCKAIIFTRDCGGPALREGSCITCGQWRVLQWGHFIRQQDSKWLQYDPRNTGGQCAGCNGPAGRGRVLEYAIAIDKRDGVGASARLQAEAVSWKGWRPNRSALEKKLEQLQKHPLAPKGEAPPLAESVPTAKPSKESPHNPIGDER